MTNNLHKNVQGDKISLENWRTHPYNRIAFSKVDNILPYEVIHKGTKEIRFDSKIEDISLLEFSNKYNEKQTIINFFDKNLTDSFQLFKKGNKIFEWFDNYNLRSNRHILFSVSKSLTSLAVGLLVENKLINTNQEITFYIPEVKNSAFDNATIRNLLDMTISTNFKEEYLDKTGIFNLYREATGFNPKTSNNNIGLKDFLKLMPKSKEKHGIHYHYCSPNTDLLGWIIEKVTGTSFGNYFSKEIFQKCCPQYDAFITLDHEKSPRTAGGICMVIDDLAKLSEMVRCKGSFDNKQIIKERTISELIDYNNDYNWPSIEKGNLFPNGSYRSKWYQTGLKNKEIYASGIHGQKIWIDPLNEISIIMFSSRKQPLSPSFEKNFSLMCLEICKFL